MKDVFKNIYLARKRKERKIVLETIKTLEKRFGKAIPIKNIIREALPIIAAGMVEDTIERLKRRGDVYEPKRGFLEKI